MVVLVKTIEYSKTKREKLSNAKRRNCFWLFFREINCHRIFLPNYLWNFCTHTMLEKLDRGSKFVICAAIQCFLVKRFFRRKVFNGQKIPTAKSNYIQPLFLSSKWEEKQHCIGSSIKYSRSLSLKNHGINYKSSHFIVESFTLDFQRFIFPVQ